jgi:hypothetical protein
MLVYPLANRRKYMNLTVSTISTKVSIMHGVIMLALAVEEYELGLMTDRKETPGNPKRFSRLHRTAEFSPTRTTAEKRAR